MNLPKSCEYDVNEHNHFCVRECASVDYHSDEGEAVDDKCCLPVSIISTKYTRVTWVCII
jgi:hypothetical protein